MTKTTKILLGVGAIALAYYFYTKRGKGGTQPQVETTSSPKNDGIGAIPRKVECDKRLIEKLKTMRPDDLEKFKSEFMSNCLSQEAIKYDACQEKQANVMFKDAKGYGLAIGNCMGCKKGEIYSISSTDGKMKCQVPIYMY